jgi:hypothetical protein
MFATKIKFRTALLLMTLTGSGVCLTGYSAAQAQERVPNLPQEARYANLPAAENDTRFPDGVLHNFGNLQRGVQARHAFRIVNLANVPLQIVSVRCHSGALSGRSTKQELQPNEVATVEISLDTRRFRGPKTASLWLTLDNGITTETRFTITANSLEGPQP